MRYHAEAIEEFKKIHKQLDNMLLTADARTNASNIIRDLQHELLVNDLDYWVVEKSIEHIFNRLKDNPREIIKAPKF